MNDFPTKTFSKGVEIASYLRNESKNVMFAFIVNDWQWVNKGLFNFPTKRNSYYEKQTLPSCFIKLLQMYKFGFLNILRTDHYVSNSIFFSEHKLRKQGKKVTSDCSPESCAIEYLPFLLDSMKCFETLISFIPMTCKIPVLYATIKFIKERDSNINLFHIFYDPTKQLTEMTFLNSTNLTIEYENNINESFMKMELMSK
jgi:hypothetical protein